MSVELRLKVTQRALRTIADMPVSELKMNAPNIALRALAISNAPLPNEHYLISEREVRAMEELIERVEDLTRKIELMESTKETSQGVASDQQVNWVKVEKYAELTGDSVGAVNGRRKLGKWLDGNEYKIVDGRIWIDLIATQRWVEEWDAHRPALVGGLAKIRRRPK